MNVTPRKKKKWWNFSPGKAPCLRLLIYRGCNSIYSDRRGPSEKYARQFGSSSPNSGENKKSLKPPPSRSKFRVVIYSSVGWKAWFKCQYVSKFCDGSNGKFPIETTKSWSSKKKTWQQKITHPFHPCFPTLLWYDLHRRYLEATHSQHWNLHP